MFLYFMWDNENIFLVVGLVQLCDDGVLGLSEVVHSSRNKLWSNGISFTVCSFVLCRCYGSICVYLYGLSMYIYIGSGEQDMLISVAI